MATLFLCLAAPGGARPASAQVLLSSAVVKGTDNGGTAMNFAKSIALDASGNAYVAGSLTNGSGTRNVWVAKYSPAMVALASATIETGGGFNDGNAVALDGLGNVYVGGGANQNSDIWIGKFDVALVLLASRTVSLQPAAGPGEWAESLAMDGSGNLLVGGLVHPSTLTTSGWVAKLDPSLVVLSSRTVGNGGWVRSIAADGSGGAFATGNIGNDIWVGHLDSSMNLVATATVAGAAGGQDSGQALLVTSSGVFVAGYEENVPGQFDIWLGRLNTALALQKSAVVASVTGKFEEANALAASPTGRIFVGGHFWSDSMRGDDFWLAEINSDLVILGTTTFNNSGGDRIYTVAAGTTDVWAAGYSYLPSQPSPAWLSRHDASQAQLSPSGVYAFDGSALSETSILWTWPEAVWNETGFRVLSGTISLSGILPADTTSWVQTGLSTNTSYGPYIVQAFNSTGTSNSPAATAYTSAGAPASLAVNAVYATSATLTWFSNSNPVTTFWELQRSTNGVAYSTVYLSSPTASYTDTGLAASTSYYYQVRALNGDFIGTAYIGPANVVTGAAAPPPGTVTYGPNYAYFSGASGGSDVANSVALAPSGNLYVVGYSNQGASDKDIWVAKFAAPGLTLLSSATLNGNANGADFASGVAVDPSENVYVIGQSSLASAGLHPWIGKFDSSLHLLSSTTVSNPYGNFDDNEPGNPEPSILVAPNGDLWVTAALRLAAGNSTLYLARYSPSLALQSSTTFSNGGMNSNAGYGIALDASGRAYVSGARALPGSSNDIWVGKFDTNLVFLSSAVRAGSNTDNALGVLVDPGGNVYVVGQFNASGSIDDAWIGKYSADLALLQEATFKGNGASNDAAYAIRSGNGGDLIVAGQITNSGTGRDIWLAQYSSALVLKSSVAFNNTGGSDDTGFGLAVDTTAATAYVAGYVTNSSRDAWLGRFPIASSATPSAPTSFAGLASSSRTISWNWTDNATNESGYRVMSGTINVSGDLAANTTYWTQTGLSANVLAGPYLVRAFNGGGTSDSPNASRYTLVNGAAGISVDMVGSSSATISWLPNGNPASTRWELQRSTNGVAYSTVYLSSPTASYTDTGLTASTSFYYKVRALNGDAIPSIFIGPAWVHTMDPPIAPVGFAGAASAAAQMTWSWIDSATNEAGYRVMSGTVSLSGDLPANTTVWVQTGLGANQLMGPYFVRAFNGAGSGDSSPASRYTLANPSGGTDTRVYSSSVTLSWTSGGNPAGTQWELRRSTDGGFVFSTIRQSSGPATYTDTGLAPIRYGWDVRAANGNGIVSAPKMFAYADISTGPVTFLSAQAVGPTSILWSWPASVIFDTGYRVMSGTVPVSGDLSGGATTWLQLGLSTNTRYGPYYLQGFDGASTAELDEAVSRYTLTAPPNSISVTVLGSSASFTWPTMSNPAGTRWSVERGTNGVVYSQLYFSSGPASFLDAGLAIATTYHYRIRAANGEGVYSFYANASAIVWTGDGGLPPAAPSSFAGFASSTRTIRWNWTDNANNEAGYRVMAGTVSLSGNLPANTTTWGQSGLSPNTLAGPYFVRAFNATGSSDSFGALRYTFANVLSGLSASMTGPSSAAVGWNANGNAALTGWELQRSTSGANYSTIYESSATASFLDSGMLPNTTYFYQVRAKNGDAVATAFAGPVSVYTFSLPAAASGLVGTALDANRIQWTWTDNAVNEQGYRVMAGTVNLSGSLVANAASWVQMELAPNTLAGPCVVRAFNALGTSDSPSASRYTLAVPPASLTPTGVSSTTIGLAWSANGNPAGTVWDLQRSTGGGFTTIFLASGTPSFIDSGLTPHGTYNYQVRAANGNGLLTGFSAPIMTGALPPDAPYNPTGFAGTTIDTDKIRWSWTDNAINEAGYRVLVGTISVSGDLPAGTTTWLQGGLPPSALIGPVFARAFNSGGSNDSLSTMKYTWANPPSGLGAAMVGASSATIAWSAGGNGPGTLWDLRRSTDGVAYATVYQSSAASAFLETSMLGNTTYFYQARARNPEGVWTAFAGPATVYTGNPITPPAAPSAFAGAGVDSSKIRWTWTDNATDETGYRVMAGTFSLSGDLPLNTTAWIQAGLPTNAPAGPYFVRAFNSGGASDSAGGSRYTLAAAPAWSTLTVSSVSVALAWSANGNPPGTVYEALRSTGAGWVSLQTSSQALSLLDAPLPPNTTVQYQVRAANVDGLTSASFLTAVTAPPAAPAAPSGFAGTAVGTTRILWSWAGNAGNEAGYRVLSGATNLSGDLPPNTSTWLQNGLSTNTAYGPLRAQAFNAGGAADSGSASRWTLAAVPTGIQQPVSRYYSNPLRTELEVRWSSASQPAGTVFEFFRSTNGGSGPFVSIATTTATSYTDTGPAVSSCYATYIAYKVRALNGEGVPSGLSGYQNLQYFPAPAGPSGTSSVALSSGAIFFAWTDNACNEAGYRILRGTVSISGDLPPNTTTWVMTGLAPNTVYNTYWVMAFAPNTTSSINLPQRYTFAGIPGAPTPVAVASTTITVGWTADGNSAGTRYQLERSSGPGFVLIQQSTSALTYLDRGLQSSSTYQYRIRALNAEGIATAYAGPVSVVTTLEDAPAAPLGFAGTALGANGIRWSWSPGSSNERGFRVAAGTASLSGDLPAGTTSWTQFGLSPNTLYGPFTAQAFNRGGASGSAAASRRTLASAPASLAVVAVTSSAISLAWPASGNPAGTQYKLERSTGGAPSTLATTLSLAHTDSGLAPETLYGYRVIAINADGVFTPAGPSTAAVTSPEPAPAAPAGLVGTPLSTTRLLWTWTDASAGELGLRVMSGAGNLSGNLPPNTTYWVQTSLSTNTVYGPYRVQAFNSGGISESGVATAGTLSATPSDFYPQAVSPVTATLDWSPNGNPEGTRYAAAISLAPSPSTFGAPAVSTSASFTGLVPATIYYFAVVSYSSAGAASPPAHTYVRTADVSAPAAPSGFAGSATGATSIVWSWSDNAGNETGVRVMSGAANLSGDLAPGTTSWAQLGLQPNTLYGPCFARALNAGGTADSGLDARTTLAAVPTALNVTSVSSTTASLSWSAAGNSAGTRYRLERSSGGVFTLAKDGLDAAFLDQGLKPATTYTYRVQAVNFEGVLTAFGPAVSALTALPAPPPAPTGLAAVAVSRGALRWTWLLNSDNEAGVRVLGGAANVSGDLPARTNAWLQTGLSTNTAYGPFVVAVFNEAGTASSVAPVSRYTLATPPSALAVSASSVSTSLSWSSGTNPSGTRFEVHRASTGGFGLIATVAGTAWSDAGLEPLTAYLYQVRALNGDGVPTAFGKAASVLTAAPDAPAAPTGFAGTAQSVSSIQWDWTDAASNETGYRVLSGAVNISGDLPAGRTYWVQTGLSANAPVGPLRVQAFNAGGTSESAAASRYTLAAAPSGLRAAAISQTTAALAWAADDPAGTLFELQRSSSQPYATIATQAALAFNDGALETGTLFRYRVRAFNGDGLATDFAGPLEVRTNDLTAPVAPTAFSGLALDTSRIEWKWLDNASDEVGYRVLSGEINLSGALPPGTTSWVQAGLTAASVYGPYVVQAFNSGGGATSGNGTRATLPETPASLAVTAISSVSAILAWPAGANPAGTRYELERSAGEAAFALARPVADVAAADDGLLPATAYSWRVRALNSEGAPSAYSPLATYTTLVAAPAAPAGLAGTASSASQVRWTWLPVEGAIAYRLYYASSPATLLAATQDASYIESGGLGPNEPRRTVVSAVNSTGEGARSAPAAVYTFANPPAGLAANWIEASSAALSWSINGNPAGTRAEAERALAGGEYQRVLLAATSHYADYALSMCLGTTVRVRMVNGDGAATEWATPLSFTTRPQPPLPPAGLAAASLAGNLIQLQWTPSPSEGITGYNLYFDAALGAIDYLQPLKALASADTQWAAGPLAVKPAYRFGLRAVNRCGVEEPNTTVVAEAASLSSLTGVRTLIKKPAAGKSIDGKEVEVLAELVLGDVSQVKQVLFQIRRTGETQWSDIVSNNAAQPNPATKATGIQWHTQFDGNVLAQGASYDLRAVAMDYLGNTDEDVAGGSYVRALADLRSSRDPAPPAITITVDHVNPDIRETSLGGGIIQSEQKINNGVANTVSSSDGDSTQSTAVTIPAGALASSTATVTVVNNPIDVPPIAGAVAQGLAEEGVEAANAYVEITLSGGQTMLANGKTAALSIGYVDDNNDGVVDGTTLRVENLELYTFDAALGQWRKESASVVDTTKHQVTAQTPHFSLFGLFGRRVAHAALANVRVYPVPYKPNGGDPNEGRPYAAGDANSGIIFDNLPPGSVVTIYTATGRRVRKLSVDVGNRLQWDARNEDGRDVASGGYVAVITSPGQETMGRVIAIIR